MGGMSRTSSGTDNALDQNCSSRAAGRSLPGYGNIVDKIIRNSISDAVSVSALTTFL